MTATDHPSDPASDAELRGRNIRRLRRHAVWIERLAASVGTAGCALAVLLALAVPLLWIAALAGVLGALTAWALLRALALVLHVRADEAAVVAAAASV
ncbi:MAG: hypothetical protein JWO77_1887 [Ilumatobacteraceae bacterium]|nr:hypothetical protein [Ilumatobacteraceae bacterium]